MILEPAVGRATALLNRVSSAFTQKVMGLVCEILSVHQVLPAEISGQLRFLGSSLSGGDRQTSGDAPTEKLGRRLGVRPTPWPSTPQPLCGKT